VYFGSSVAITAPVENKKNTPNNKLLNILTHVFLLQLAA
jgi:hypothetical protein